MQAVLRSLFLLVAVIEMAESKRGWSPTFETPTKPSKILHRESSQCTLSSDRSIPDRDSPPIMHYSPRASSFADLSITNTFDPEPTIHGSAVLSAQQGKLVTA